LNFYSIGSVPFESNNSNYLFNDNQPNSGSNYYQIKEIDIDGKSTLSKIIKVVKEDQLFNIKIKNNPFSDQLSFICQSNIKQNATIIISDGLAKPMYQKQIKLNAGENNFAIDCKAWPSGIYFLQIIGYYNRISLKTIKL
ncbi:MAG: T9SS type A sorting domain-containing protein, partial [Flavisolibacter sp.]